MSTVWNMCEQCVESVRKMCDAFFWKRCASAETFPPLPPPPHQKVNKKVNKNVNSLPNKLPPPCGLGGCPGEQTAPLFFGRQKQFPPQKLGVLAPALGCSIFSAKAAPGGTQPVDSTQVWPQCCSPFCYPRNVKSFPGEWSALCSAMSSQWHFAKGAFWQTSSLQ